VPSYRMHGLTIATDHDLPHDRMATGLETGYHLTIGTGEDEHDLEGWPQGTKILSFGEPELRYALTETETGHLYRHPDLCEYRLADDKVTVHALSDGPRELIPLVTIGNLITLVLELKQHYVLHASAVELGGKAIALVGPSGAGKTTTAAILTTAGLPLVSDDVLRLDLDVDQITAWAGGTRLRLRPSSSPLFKGVETSDVTADGRFSLLPAPVTPDNLPLGAIVSPVPVGLNEPVRVRRLRGMDAIRLLASEPRFMDWGTAAYAAHRLESAAAVARAVPVVEMTIPWGARDGGPILAALNEMMG
jgi:hypothetical protein